MDIEEQFNYSRHAGAKDKGGSPTFFTLSTWWWEWKPMKKIVAILHDVVEDTDWTFEALRKEGFQRLF